MGATAFFAVQAFETRMQMVDALMTQFASDEQGDKWECLHKKIRKKGSKRNTVAHGLFAFFGTPPKRKAVLCRSVYNSTRFPENPRQVSFLCGNRLRARRVTVLPARGILLLWKLGRTAPGGSAEKAGTCGKSVRRGRFREQNIVEKLARTFRPGEIQRMRSC